LAPTTLVPDRAVLACRVVEPDRRKALGAAIPYIRDSAGLQ
jgi:hypothetical protein